jgi:hypothetical protein
MNTHSSITVLLILTSIAFCSAQTVRQGNISLQAGVGLVPTYFLDGGKNTFPTMTGMVQYQVTDIFSIGTSVAYAESTSAQKSLTDGTSFQWRSRSTHIGLRAQVHAAQSDRFDLYGGAQLAYEMPSVQPVVQVFGESALPVSSAKNKLMYAGFVGATWYPSPKIGFYGEIGFGLSLVNTGIKLQLRRRA